MEKILTRHSRKPPKQHSRQPAAAFHYSAGPHLAGLKAATKKGRTILGCDVSPSLLEQTRTTARILQVAGVMPVRQYKDVADIRQEADRQLEKLKKKFDVAEITTIDLPARLSKPATGDEELVDTVCFLGISYTGLSYDCGYQFVERCLKHPTAIKNACLGGLGMLKQAGYSTIEQLDSCAYYLDKEDNGHFEEREAEIETAQEKKDLAAEKKAWKKVADFYRTNPVEKAIKMHPFGLSSFDNEVSEILFGDDQPLKLWLEACNWLSGFNLNHYCCELSFSEDEEILPHTSAYCILYGEHDEMYEEIENDRRNSATNGTYCVPLGNEFCCTTEEVVIDNRTRPMDGLKEAIDLAFGFDLESLQFYPEIKKQLDNQKIVFPWLNPQNTTRPKPLL